tara:strand:+ start:659 stop:1963 length:1305 start_codon:yes stop_codon:yes gene_type:complete
MEIRVHAYSVSTRNRGPEPYRVERLTFLRLAKGRTRWSIDGEKFELREGDVLLVRPGQVFSGIESSEQVSIHVESVELEWKAGNKARGISLEVGSPFRPEQATLLRKTLLDSASPVLSTNAELGALFSKTISKAKDESPLSQLECQACAVHLLTSICAALSKRQSKPTNVASSVTEHRVAGFLSELESRAHEDWTLTELAGEVGLRRSRFGVICRQITGESPSTYLNRLRIRRSRQLLRDTDRSITEIAFECGFNSSQYFAKLFRRFQGHEPTHYREIAREMQRGKGIRYLKGDSARIVVYADEVIGKGDVEIGGVISLDRLGGTAASLEFGGDRFGFDGREGRFFLEGETLGSVRFFRRNADVIREETPFPFQLRRKGNRLRITVNDQLIASLTDDPDRAIGRVGLRPLRNGIRVAEFRIDGRAVVLKEAMAR